MNNTVLIRTVKSQTSDCISSIDIDEDNTIKALRSLNTNKAHGYYEISKRLLKICDSCISKPPLMILENYISQGESPDVWKKVPVLKKMTKNL